MICIVLLTDASKPVGSSRAARPMGQSKMSNHDVWRAPPDMVTGALGAAGKIHLISCSSKLEPHECCTCDHPAGVSPRPWRNMKARRVDGGALVVGVVVVVVVVGVDKEDIVDRVAMDGTRW